MSKTQVTEIVDRDARAARAAAAKIKAGAAQMIDGLYEFAKIKGWLALGYPSFTSWAETEMSWARSTAYLRLKEANVLVTMSSALGLAGAPDVRLTTATIRNVTDEADARQVVTEVARKVKALPPAEQIRAVEQHVARRTATREPAKVVSALAARFRQLTDALDAMLEDTDDDALDAARALHDKLGYLLAVRS